MLGESYFSGGDEDIKAESGTAVNPRHLDVLSSVTSPTTASKVSLESAACFLIHNGKKYPSGVRLLWSQGFLAPFELFRNFLNLLGSYSVADVGHQS